MQPALIIILVGLGVVHPRSSTHVELESEILLTVVLPPLLYSAALGFSFANFVRNIRPSSASGVAMVVITAFAVGWVTSTVLRDSPLPSPCCSVRSSPRPMR